MVGLVFLPQNFGPVVGTYKGCFLFCECRWGGDSHGGGGDISTLHAVTELV